MSHKPSDSVRVSSSLTTETTSISKAGEDMLKFSVKQGDENSASFTSAWKVLVAAELKCRCI